MLCFAAEGKVRAQLPSLEALEIGFATRGRHPASISEGPGGGKQG